MAVRSGRLQPSGGWVEQLLGLLVGLQKGLDLLAQRWTARTGTVQKRRPFCRGSDLDGRQED
jgi:hypothetical protein